jgi:hypothetical protein
MERCRQLFGYSVRKIIYGMKDSVQVEAVSNQSGDVPNQTWAILDNLPEAPEIEVKAEAVESKTAASE